MALRPSIQGWAIDPTHPASSTINLSNIFTHLDTLHPPHAAYSTTFSRSVHTFVMAHTHAILSSSLFLRAPIGVLQRILSLPNLSVSEDFILSRLLAYAADIANVLSDSPAFWTDTERELMLPILLQLIPYVRFLSISSEQCVKVVEPMRILDKADLIEKYKFDALERQLCGDKNPGTTAFGGGNSLRNAHTFATIRRCYQDPRECEQIFQSKLRGTIAISESSHPYPEGEDDQVLEEVSVSSWAPKMLVEFDRRTSIGIGAQLVFYKDRDARQVISSWHEMWPRGRHGIKTFVVKGHKFYIGFRSSFSEHTKWGWKLIAMPLFHKDDFD